MVKVWLELERELSSVRLFHDEDEFSPAHELRSNRCFSTVIQPRRGYFYSGVRRKYLLGRRAAKAVLTANKQHVFHSERDNT